MASFVVPTISSRLRLTFLTKPPRVMPVLICIPYEPCSSRTSSTTTFETPPDISDPMEMPPPPMCCVTFLMKMLSDGAASAEA